MNDRVCDLECMKEGANVHEFVGPVKIILVDPPEDQYNRRRSGAAFLTLADMMMAVNTVLMFLFTIGFKLPKFINMHIMLCSIGTQFLMPFAILMINPLHGPAAPMKKNSRKIEHLCLQLLGLACFISGSILAILKGEKSVLDPPPPHSSIHFISGVVALGLATITLLFGPLLFILKTERGSPPCLTCLHRFFGVLTLIMSSVCFIFGIMKPTMQLWLYIIGYMAPSYMIVFFSAFYTLVAITGSLSKIFGHPKDQ